MIHSFILKTPNVGEQIRREETNSFDVWSNLKWSILYLLIIIGLLLRLYALTCVLSIQNRLIEGLTDPKITRHLCNVGGLIFFIQSRIKYIKPCSLSCLMPLKSIRNALLYCSLLGGLVIGAFYLREVCKFCCISTISCIWQSFFFAQQLSLIHIAVERIKNGLCSNGCDVHHLLTKLHPKFDILRLFLLAMCVIVLLAVVSTIPICLLVAVKLIWVLL